VVSWGHAGSQRLPPGASTLEVRLSRRGAGTLVEIVHRGLSDPEATRHQAGWRRFLGQLATAAADVLSK
jgi:Activator of Hsp90 ATPase homolog 1-like protein